MKWTSLVLLLVACAADRTGLAVPEGVDGGPGVDAGERDASLPDAAPVPDGGDGGSPDPDGGFDAGLDGGTDAGMDSGPVCPVGTLRCSGMELQRCDGTAYVTERTCTLGCGDVGGSHCMTLVPSNVSLDFLPEEPGSIEVSSMTYDTDDCDEGMVVDQDGGGEVCVLRWPSDVRVTGMLRVIGGRPLIGLVSGDLSIEDGGGFDLGANGREPGAGGGFGAATDGSGTGGAAPGGNGLQEGTYSDGGGGGGGGCGIGGSGGFGSSDGPGGDDRAFGGAGGAAFAGDYLLSPLRGGSGGGRGARSTRGGGGGGALQLSVLGQLVVRGRLDVGGAGGDGGDSSGNYEAGGGGGSGGGLLLEAGLGVTFAASSQAWAGGGGGGGAGGSSTGGVGGNGDQSPPMGGTSGGAMYGARGGAGGTTGDGTPGADNDTRQANGGGGGGGAGCVVVRAPGASTTVPVPPVGQGVFRGAEPRIE